MPQSLIDGSSAGVWQQKPANAVTQAAAVLGSSSLVTGLSGGNQTQVQRAARAVAAMPRLRPQNRFRKIYW
jgi:hypothetical protein